MPCTTAFAWYCGIGYCALQCVRTNRNPAGRDSPCTPVAVPARRAWSGRWRRSPPEVPLPLVAWPTTLRHTFGFEPLTFGMPGPLGSALWVTANPPARVSPATWCAAAVVGRASTGSRACFTCVTYIRAYSCPPPAPRVVVDPISAAPLRPRSPGGLDTPAPHHAPGSRLCRKRKPSSTVIGVAGGCARDLSRCNGRRETMGFVHTPFPPAQLVGRGLCRGIVPYPAARWYLPMLSLLCHI